MMTLTLSSDHWFMGGARAAPFSKHFAHARMVLLMHSE
jgi:hypothetical protein